MQQRLFQITYLLIERGNVTAGELAERFGVSQRTIYRDIDALSGAGVPVYAQKGRGGGIRLLPDFVVDKALFTEDEQEQLVGGLGSLASLHTPDSEALYDKLAALFGGQEPWLEVDFAPWSAGESMRGLFRLLRQAILTRRVVQFRYAGTQGEMAERSAEPARILFRNQSWYLYAWCRTRQDWRIFKLSRMQGCSATDEGFVARSIPPQPSLPPLRRPLLEVELVFEADAAYRVYDEWPPEQVSVLEDNRLRVLGLLPDEPYTVGMLLAYGDALEVVAPQALRDRLVEQLEKTAKKYRIN